MSQRADNRRGAFDVRAELEVDHAAGLQRAAKAAARIDPSQAAAGAKRRVRRLSSGIASRLIALRASSISAALIWAKSFDRKISAADMVSRASSSIAGGGLAWSLARFEKGVGDAAGPGPQAVWLRL